MFLALSHVLRCQTYVDRPTSFCPYVHPGNELEVMTDAEVRRELELKSCYSVDVNTEGFWTAFVQTDWFQDSI